MPDSRSEETINPGPQIAAAELSPPRARNINMSQTVSRATRSISQRSLEAAATENWKMELGGPVVRKVPEFETAIEAHVSKLRQLLESVSHNDCCCWKNSVMSPCLVISRGSIGNLSVSNGKRPRTIHDCFWMRFDEGKNCSSWAFWP